MLSMICFLPILFNKNKLSKSHIFCDIYLDCSYFYWFFILWNIICPFSLPLAFYLMFYKCCIIQKHISYLQHQSTVNDTSAPLMIDPTVTEEDTDVNKRLSSVGQDSSSSIVENIGISMEQFEVRHFG